MIRHYLKVAFRNLLKYKTQNIISIIGLAVGLLCFCICIVVVLLRPPTIVSVITLALWN